MSSLINSYEQQFSSLTAEVVQRMGRLPSSHGGMIKIKFFAIETTH